MPCKLCRFAYACRALRKDDMNQEEIKEFNKKVSSLKGTNPAQILSELEAESESRTDRLLDELADNMAKADEAMKPDKPLEQSEFTKIIRPRIDDDNFSQADMEDACDIIDRQTTEIKRLKSIICKMNPDIIIAPDKESLEELSEIAKIFGEQALERK